MKLNAQMMAALRTFDVAARTSSFTNAAKELHITAAAVSQQMGHFEQQLKLTLFERHSRGIRLTKAGAMLQAVVEPSLNNISQTINQLQGDACFNQEIRVKSTPSFAYKWLVPRLQDFYQHHPQLQVQIFADGALVDKEVQDYDLAIDFAPIPYPSDDVMPPELLMAEALIPVMSPQYAARHDWQDPACWQQVNLLHDTMPWQGAPAECEWLYWFEQRGLSQYYCRQGHYFNRADLAMEAASAGQGIALARQALLANDLASGHLVSPFKPMASNSGYYLVVNHSITNIEHLSAIAHFKQWLRQQVKNQKSQ